MSIRHNDQATGQRQAPRALRAFALAAMAATLLVGGCAVYEDNHRRPGHGHGPGFHDRHDDRGDRDRGRWDRRGGDDRRHR